MNFEDQKNNTQEKIKTQEATAETPATVEEGELREQMAEQSQKEVAGFQAEGSIEMEADKKRAETEGLDIDNDDRLEFDSINQEAIAAGKKLKEEIKKEGEEKDKIKVCKKCGKEGLRGGNFCTECGSKLEYLEIEESDVEIKESLSEEDIAKINSVKKTYLEAGASYSNEKDAVLDDFLTDYLEKEGAFSLFFRNPETAPFALEMTRMMLMSKSEKTQDESEKAKYEFLLREVAFSLGAIEETISGDDIKSDSKKEDRLSSKTRLKNNAFYSVSEVLGSADLVSCQKANKWMKKHFENVLDPNLKQETEDGWSDHASEIAFSNVISYATDGELLKKALVENSKGEGLESAIGLGVKALQKEVAHPRERRRIIAECLAEKLSLNSKVVEKWSKSKVFSKKDEKGSDIFKESYERNIKAALDLEKKHPGASRKLFDEFGIANFARYSSDMLIHQLENSDQDVPYGVVVFPEDDHNGGFFGNEKVLETMGTQLSEGGYETRITEAASQFEMARRLNRFNNKYAKNGNKMSFLVLGGHGTPDSVTLGKHEPQPPPFPGSMPEDEYQKTYKAWENENGDPLRKIMTISDIKDGGGKGMRRASGKWFTEKAPVIFVSCSTGTKNGIAQAASEELGFSTFGPDKDTRLGKIDVDFDGQGKPVFNVEYFMTALNGEIDRANSMRYVSKEKHE